MNRFLPPAVLAILLVLAGCETTPEPPTEFESAPLMGMIYSVGSRPVLGMELVMDDEVRAISDIEGRFIFADVSRGPHRITANLADFEPIDYVFEFTDRTQVLHLIATSLYDLIHRLEEAVASRDRAGIEALSPRIEAIDPDSPDYLYLRALGGYVTGNPTEANIFLERLNGLGIASNWIDRLRQIIDSDDELAPGEPSLIDPTFVDPDAEAAAVEEPVDPDAQPDAEDVPVDPDAGTSEPDGEIAPAEADSDEGPAAEPENSEAADAFAVPAATESGDPTASDPTIDSGDDESDATSSEE